MSKDIVPELLEAIQKDFNSSMEKSSKLHALKKMIENETASYVEINDYAKKIGELLSRSLQKNISSNVLPDGKMYFNIAKRILEPTLGNNYKLVTEVATMVQKTLNRKNKINIKPQVPKINKDRIDGFLNRVSNEDNFDEVSWILEEPITNFTQSVVNDFVDENIKFQYKAGLRPKLIRKENGRCCNWCRDVIGTYKYPDVPKDVYKRHSYCKCTVEYFPGDGTKENVHTKIKSRIQEDQVVKKKRRRKFDSKKTYKNFYDGSQANEYFEDHSKALRTKKAKDAKDAFRVYTNTGYISINSALRQGKDFFKHVVSEEMKERIVKRIESMKKFISEQVLKNDIIVYRAMDKKYIEEQVGRLEDSIGKSFIEKAFASTSPLKKSAEKFYRGEESVLIKYHVPKGKGRGAYINSVSDFKNIEYEYLLANDTEAKILGYEQKGGKNILIVEIVKDENK